MTALDEALKTVGGAVKSAVKGENILHSNSAISKITAGVLNNGLGAGELAYKFSKSGDLGKAFADTFKDGDKLKYGKIAGSYIGLSAAARVATGGGLYRDRNGNTNIAGVPFV